MSILGIKIPKWDTIKAIGIGIYNWVTIGLPNMLIRVRAFVGKIGRFLFGKRGLINSVPKIKYTLNRIFYALIAGAAKKGLAILATIAQFIPGWGTAISFVLKLASYLVPLIMNNYADMYYGAKMNKELVLSNIKRA